MLPQEIMAANVGYKSDYAMAYKGALSAEVNYSSARARLNHTVLGRTGDASMMKDAGAAALDGSGGFEINDMEDLGRVISSKTALFLSRYGTVIDSAGSFAGGVAGLHAKVPGYGTIVGLIGDMPGINEAMNWYKAGTTGINPWEEFYKNQDGQHDVRFVKEALNWVEQLMRNRGLSQEEIDELLFRRKQGLSDSPYELPQIVGSPDPDSLFGGKKTIGNFYHINRTIEPDRL